MRCPLHNHCFLYISEQWHLLMQLLVCMVHICSNAVTIVGTVVSGRIFPFPNVIMTFPLFAFKLVISSLLHVLIEASFILSMKLANCLSLTLNLLLPWAYYKQSFFSNQNLQKIIFYMQIKLSQGQVFACNFFSF